MMLAFYKKTKNKKKQSFLYYYLHDYQGNLFSKYGFTIIWGKEISKGVKREYTFESRIEKDNKIRSILKKRVNENYKLLYSYPVINNYEVLFNNYTKTISQKAIRKVV